MIPPIGYKLCISNVIPRATSNKAIRNTLKKKKSTIYQSRILKLCSNNTRKEKKRPKTRT